METKITMEYGRVAVVTNAQMDEWLDDLPAEIDEVMAQPLHVGSRLAWCAPEVIRGAVVSEILRSKLIAMDQRQEI